MGKTRRRRLPPLLRQLTDDPTGRGVAAQSGRSAAIRPRNAKDTADKVVDSVCPYCAVGCGQKLYVKDEKVVHVEGDPNSPVSRGRLCPRGSSTPSLINSPTRVTTVRYRPPNATDWQDLDLDTAVDMIADRVIAARASHWQDKDEKGRALNRTTGVASLGGATLDNEENYLIKKLFTALGAIQVENQARI